MRQISPLAIAGLLALAAGTAQADTRVRTTCQKNLTTERVLVTDGRSLPADARYDVVNYQPTSNDGVWSYGPCVLALRGGRAR